LSKGNWINAECPVHELDVPFAVANSFISPEVGVRRLSFPRTTPPYGEGAA